MVALCMKRLAFSVVTGAGEHRPLQRSPGYRYRGDCVTGEKVTVLLRRKTRTLIGSSLISFGSVRDCLGTRVTIPTGQRFPTCERVACLVVAERSVKG